MVTPLPSSFVLWLQLLAANAKLATANRSAYLPFGFAGGRRAAEDDFAQDDILPALTLTRNKSMRFLLLFLWRLNLCV